MAAPVGARVPEQGLPGEWWLVCARARWSLPGHLLVDIPGSHPDPQHGGQRGVVQQDAYLWGEADQPGLRGPSPPACCPWTLCVPRGPGLSPAAPFAFSGGSSIVTGNETSRRACGASTQGRCPTSQGGLQRLWHWLALLPCGEMGLGAYGPVHTILLGQST